MSYLPGVEKEGLDLKATVGLHSDLKCIQISRSAVLGTLKFDDICLSIQLVGAGAPFPLQGTSRLPERQHLPNVIPAYRCIINVNSAQGPLFD